MFYAMAKRRRDLNAAEARGREAGRQEGRRQESWQEGYREGVAAALNTIAARLGAEPGVDPMQVISELRAELQNGQTPVARPGWRR